MRLLGFFAFRAGVFNPGLTPLFQHTPMPQRWTQSIRHRVITGFALAVCGLPSASFAADEASRRTLVETPPAPLTNLYRVSAQNTPSGFAVPRYVSLKFGTVNARTGPSLNHAIAYQYQRRGLPVIVVAETEMWRKVRDIHGDEAWVRKPALSGERHAITLTETRLYTRPSGEARPIARIEKGSLVDLDSCNEDGFCEIRTENGLKGWSRQAELWGAQPLGQ
jgi:SH3-like domain-containing protein